MSDPGEDKKTAEEETTPISSVGSMPVAKSIDKISSALKPEKTSSKIVPPTNSATIKKSLLISPRPTSTSSLETLPQEIAIGRESHLRAPGIHPVVISATETFPTDLPASPSLMGRPKPAEKPIDLDEIHSVSHLSPAASSTGSLFEATKLITEMRVSLTELEMLKCPKLHGPFVSSIKKIFGREEDMRKAVFDCRDKQLFNCCLKGVKDKHQLHKNRVMGVRIINDIIERAPAKFITPPHVVNLIWSSMSCMHHFQLRLRTDSTGIIRTVRTKSIMNCMETYSRLIRTFDKTLHRVVLSSILTFYRGGRMWEFEFACTDLILDLLSIHSNVNYALTYIFDSCMEVAKENFTEAKYMFQLFYDVLKRLKWHSVSQDLMDKMVDTFESSIAPRPTDTFDITPLRKCLELCIRHAVENLKNESLMQIIELSMVKMINNESPEDDVLLEMGNIATYAASKYKMKSFLKSISPDFLNMLFELSRKNQPVGLLMSTRIWKNLIDRNRNDKIFTTPRIFFEDCNYKILIRKCSREDKQFYKTMRHIMYRLMLQGFDIASTKWHLELLYQLMALTLVEIPCGYSASTNVAIVMHLQDYAFKLTSTNLIKAHHLHAIVISIMSLICYIHNANILYKYVIDIMDHRAEWAPHLNPPLMNTYDYAVHHILWNKPVLFFEDWEAGYGLWKCFRERKKQGTKKGKQVAF